MRCSTLLVLAAYVFLSNGTWLTVHAETPRESYIRSFDYSWDMSSERPLSRWDAPFFGNFSLQQPYNFYECLMFDYSGPGCPIPNDIDALKGSYFYSETPEEWKDGNEPWFLISPYNIEELFPQNADWAYIPMCAGAFNTLEDSFVFAGGESYEADTQQLNRELGISETVFTEQFLDFISADDSLKTQIRSVGLLTIQANELLRQAWIDGRLLRPAVVLAVGECGAGGNVVQISFREPTSRFQIIPDFDYLLCKIAGLDPWDVDLCPHVRDQLDDLQILSGRYRTKVARESGEVLFRAIDINDAGDQELEI